MDEVRLKSTMRSAALRLAALTLVVGVAAVTRMPYCTNDLFLGDAADYLRSVQSGLVSVYFDRHSTSVLPFTNLVREQLKAGEHPWEYLYRRGDSSALRHFHVPAGFYGDALAMSLREPPWVHRAMAAATGSVLCGLMFTYLIRFGVPLSIAFAGTIMMAVDPRFVATNVDINPHTPFLLFGFLCLFNLIEFLQNRRMAPYIASLVCLAISLAVLELGPALMLTGIFAIGLSWQTLMLKNFFGPDRTRKVLLAVAVFLGVLLLVWPGGFIEGGYVKSYGVFIWQALFRHEELFGPINPATIWNNLFGRSIVCASLCIWAVVGGSWIYARKKSPPAMLVFVIYAVLAAALNLGNRYRNATYASEAILPLLVASIVVSSTALAHCKSKTTRLVLHILLFSVCMVRSAQELRTLPDPNDKPITIALERVISDIRRIVPPPATLLVNKYRETYSLYLPDYAIEVTQGPGTIVPLLDESTVNTKYLLLDIASIDPEATNKLNIRYQLMTSFGGTPGGVKISLYQQRIR